MITPLHPLERGYLYACGVLRFQPARKHVKPAGRPQGTKGSTAYGKIKRIAQKFLDECPGASQAEFAAARRVNYDSFKGAVWKLRREREAAA